MGALLVLLHAFARHGDIEAVKKAEAQASTSSEPEETLEELQWRIAQLKEARAKTEAELTDERLKLSHIEDHERRLRDQFNALRIAAQELEKLENAHSNDGQQATNELAAISAAGRTPRRSKQPRHAAPRESEP